MIGLLNICSHSARWYVRLKLCCAGVEAIPLFFSFGYILHYTSKFEGLQKNSKRGKNWRAFFFPRFLFFCRTCFLFLLHACYVY
ncbi:hypothetical protein BD560DRAFT_407711 [Blakeslea trispora]|nr:hypothetical protein BD560DRAFT_407711 [Blakeslea trispora]